MKRARLKQIEQCAEKAGALLRSIEMGKKHIHITLTNGRKVYTAVSPSDWRGDMNLISDMRRLWNEGKT